LSRSRDPSDRRDIRRAAADASGLVRMLLPDAQEATERRSNFIRCNSEIQASVSLELERSYTQHPTTLLNKWSATVPGIEARINLYVLNPRWRKTRGANDSFGHGPFKAQRISHGEYPC